MGFGADPSPAPIPVDRYSPGGDIYQGLAATYGVNAANSVYQAAMSGDRQNIIDAMEKVRYGSAPASTSTAAIFWNQISTDPLAAPLAGINKLAVNTLFDFLKSPGILFIGAVALFFYMGGTSLLKGKFRQRRYTKP